MPTLLAAALIVGACGAAQDDAADAAAGDSAAHAAHPAAMADAPTPEERAAIDQIIATTEPFKDIEAARAAGYTEQTPPGCMAEPAGAGAQGVHFLKPSLADAQLEPLTPELLMYEPQADGSMALVGVDYMVPFDQWQSADPPTILGRPLMRNETLGVWALHIWAFRDNPTGMFAAWNPSVSCQHAGMAH
jgi:hypothetical protein